MPTNDATAAPAHEPKREPKREHQMQPQFKPSVLFVCVHNAGRSQMAAAYLRTLGGDRVEVLSAGSAPADSINPAVAAAMAEVGIDISDQTPKLLDRDAVAASDVVITMGCGDACPIFPGKRYEDWKLDDPAGQGIDAVRPIRDEIKRRVTQLLAEITEPASQQVELSRLQPGEITPLATTFQRLQFQPERSDV